MLTTTLLAAVCVTGPPEPLQLTLSIAESTMALGVQGSQVNVFVTFANADPRPLSIWSPRCSWGYECLSFELQPLPRGVSRTVRRLPREWDKNWPQVFNLPPGRHMTRTVALGDGTWEALPLAKDTVGKFRMRAVFVTLADDESRSRNVWTGRATSNWETVEMRNHMPARAGF